jgi:dTDP-glucose pyrophosphorylase
MDFKEHLIQYGSTIKSALAVLNRLGSDAIVFVVDVNTRLVGSLTDGDVRRGLLNGLNTDSNVELFLQKNPSFIRMDQYNIRDLIALRDKTFKVIPVLNKEDQVVNVINFRFMKSFLPVDSIIMAGGRGARLSPMTDTIPKPLLRIGGKPIIQHNIEFIRRYGVSNFWLSINYLGDQIEKHFGDGQDWGININYIREDKPLGTIGAASQITGLKHDHVLISNSDILTTLDYEDFYLDFIESGADMAIASIPYTVDIPYAVLETVKGQILSFKEKPSYTYYSNGGIYFVKREVLEMIPKNSFFDATDLMTMMIEKGLKLTSYSMTNYWLDIGKPEDFAKANADINHLDL